MKCKVDDCDKKLVCKGYCNKHYGRMYRKGTLEVNLIVNDDIKRFWSYVNKTDDCWLWIGTINGRYGGFYTKGKNMTAHRYSYELHNGKVPAGLELDHLCRNRLCVNPNHLEAVTHRENVRRGASVLKKKYDLPIGVRLNGTKYRAHKSFYRKVVSIGQFDTPEDASVVYQTMILAEES